jgi:predicted phage tail protein
MLSSANSEISLRAAAVSGRNTQLSVQLEGLGARLSGAEQQIQDREAALATARTALLEKDSGLRQLEGQVAALRQQVTEAHQDGKKQDDCIRWVAVASCLACLTAAFRVLCVPRWCGSRDITATTLEGCVVC